jgi:Ca-activated chloride channel family protein
MLEKWMRNRNHLNWKAAAIIAMALLVFGCGGGGGSSSSDSDGGGTPEIVLSSAQVAFGNVVANSQGLRSADRSVQVTNTGTGSLRLAQLASANPLAAPFSVFDDNCSGVSLAPNASCSVVVRFAPLTPAAVPFTDSFDIPSNDADEPTLTVNVSGNGKGLNVTINKVDTTNPASVRMTVSVTDGNNDPVLNLLAGDFSVSEGLAPKAITTFVNQVATPVSVALNLDYSASITPVQADVEASAKRFLTNLTNPGDEASVIKFAREVREAIGFTLTNPAGLLLLNAAINAPYTDPTNATKLFDSVYGSIDKLEPRVNDRLAALVVSDGVDFDRLTGTFASTQDLEDVIDNAQAKQVFIFTIGLGSDIDTVVMQRMAVETGGQYFEAPAAADLDAIYDKISLILTNQYEITFLTSLPDGSSNNLSVVVTDPGTGFTGEDTKLVTY